MIEWVGVIRRPCIWRTRMLILQDALNCRDASWMLISIFKILTCFLLAGLSIRQGCVSYSTSKAKLVSAGGAVRKY